MVFRLALSGPYNTQAGQPHVGSGGQTTGRYGPPPDRVKGQPVRPTVGHRTWKNSPRNMQAGQPAPMSADQKFAAGSRQQVQQWGGVHYTFVDIADRAAADFMVPFFGRILSNPIGAGIVPQHMAQAYYEKPAQYANGALWWTTQQIPTSVDLQGLTDPAMLQYLLDSEEIEAVYPSTA